jgi:hypothetical protein
MKGRVRVRLCIKGGDRDRVRIRVRDEVKVRFTSPI